MLPIFGAVARLGMSFGRVGGQTGRIGGRGGVGEVLPALDFGSALGGPAVHIHARVVGLENLFSRLDELSDRRIAAAMATALTRTVSGARLDLRAEAARVFDRPKPYTLGAIVHRGATAQTLNASVLVRPGSPVLPALRAQAFGGLREQKKFEALGRTLGLPSGWFVVPAAGAELDAYGNMSRRQLREVIRQTSGGRKRGGNAYFVMPEGRSAAPGVYVRGVGRGITPVLLFVKNASYRPRFDFDGKGTASIKARFPAEVQRAYSETIERWLARHARR